ncbi:phospho-N-acetylmuramoyl-pentapeptide-transferase [Planctomicrobium sp. SH527]|uniref:phospho-N-acetylmuramoyl-pentapeptide- transferase n=1 Tax=Planctomicrobium sp. SH527 TaxID=3448123 RepID=UPI003F5C6F11
MIPWLLQHLIPLSEQLDQHTAGNSRINLTARIALAALTSFLAAIILGPAAIRWLKSRFCERIDSASPTLNRLHANKKGTPTMGGLFIIAAVIMSSVVWADLTNPYVQISIVMATAFTMLGAMDDWIKLSTSKRGLKARQKFYIQVILSLALCSWLYVIQKDRPHGLELVSPIGAWTLGIGLWMIPWSSLVIVSTSNGVNLTDGLDGLATGCSILSGAALAAICYLAGHATHAEYLRIPFISGAGELSIIIGALVGALMGFLWFNCHPAQVFMGDTGSLPIGALLALAAVVTRQEALLVVIGGVFVIETLSVIIQLTGYRLTGKRLLACSPLHNHFVFRGVHEIKIVTRFWICSALLAILGMVMLKLQ